MTVHNKLAAAVSVALLSVAGSATAEVTLYDYTEATSAYEDAYLTGIFSAEDKNEFSQAKYSAYLGLEYDRVFSSPSRDVSIDADASGSVSRDSIAGTGSTSDFDAAISGQVSNYFRPHSKGAYWFGAGSLAAQKDQVDFASDINVGLGYGRVVNATPMAKTLRLVEALRAQGSLKAVPSKSAHQSVANIINRESEYQSKHGFDLYEQYWVADIEKALGQGALGAGAIIKAYDVLSNEQFSSRLIGWRVQAGVGVEISNFKGTDGGDPQLDFLAEYHKPLSSKTQFSNVATLSPTFGDNDSYDFDNVMSLSYELTDKIDWLNSWTLQYDDTEETSSETDNSISSAFYYELDKQLELGLVTTLTKDEGDDDVEASLNLGVNYRLR